MMRLTFPLLSVRRVAACGALLGAGLAASACAPLIIGGVATAGYFSAQQRGAGTAIDDLATKAKVTAALAGLNAGNLTHVDVNVLQGDVLLTGVVDSKDQAGTIADKARTVGGVNHVYNELQAGRYTAENYAHDTWLATQVRTRLIGAKDVFNINYTVDVVRNEVYILGIARSTLEQERALYICSTTGGVAAVHNYIRIDTTPGPEVSAPDPQPNVDK